jgi:hypothetical protein
MTPQRKTKPLVVRNIPLMWELRRDDPRMCYEVASYYYGMSKDTWLAADDDATEWSGLTYIAKRTAEKSCDRCGGYVAPHVSMDTHHDTLLCKVRTEYSEMQACDYRMLESTLNLDFHRVTPPLLFLKHLISDRIVAGSYRADQTTLGMGNTFTLGETVLGDPDMVKVGQYGKYLPQSVVSFATTVYFQHKDMQEAYSAVQDFLKLPSEEARQNHLNGLRLVLELWQEHTGIYDDLDPNDVPF